MEIPETSTALLRNVRNAGGSRWPEFVSRYRPMMLAYLAAHFPMADADDIVQETLIALTDVLSRYRYEPDETGRFRNYLTGVLRNKALRACEKSSKERAARNGLEKDMAISFSGDDSEDYAKWRDAVFEIAMKQLLADERIPDKSKQIFQRLTVDGMSPGAVADAYGTSRNNVDKTKSRMIARLRSIVDKLVEVGNV